MQAQQIIKLACQIAKGPAMIQIGGQMFTLVLEDLVLNKNLKVNRVTQPIVVSPTTQYGPYALEGDYLRTYDLFYPIPSSGQPFSQGLTILLTPITMEQWDMEFKDPSMANYPYEFATDMSTQVQVWSGGTPGAGTLTSAGQLFIYPQSSGVLTLTHRYMKNQPAIVNPEVSTVTPWFVFTEYLVQRTAWRMMGITGDDRTAEWEAMTDKMLRPHLIMEGDEQEAVHRVKLDPRQFRTNRSLRPTKSMPFSW
jgi:hypothetical protein